MNVPDYTLVLGVDHDHIPKLQLVLQSWERHKPSLLERPIVIFIDRESPEGVLLPGLDVKIVQWPDPGIEYEGTPGDRWSDPQRAKMLSGFVHVPAHHVETPYWLKLDLDVVATGRDDWIDPNWFADEPAIVAHRWSYTKPADQMLKLDEWSRLTRMRWLKDPLCLTPKDSGSTMVSHSRIISWCGFFRTDFTAWCSTVAKHTCGEGKLPVPSQDGFLWYCAERNGWKIVRTNMKSRGWSHQSRLSKIREKVEEALA